MAQNRTIRRSDIYPVGTVVSVFSGDAGSRRGYEGQKPAGVVLSTATVAADGTLKLTNLPDGRYTLWAQVAGQHVTTGVDATPYAPPPTLQERLAARRVAAGV